MHASLPFPFPFRGDHGSKQISSSTLQLLKAPRPPVPSCPALCLKMVEPVGAFEAVVSAFSQQVAELREATLLRVDGEQQRSPRRRRSRLLPP